LRVRILALVDIPRRSELILPAEIPMDIGLNSLMGPLFVLLASNWHSITTNNIARFFFVTIFALVATVCMPVSVPVLIMIPRKFITAVVHFTATRPTKVWQGYRRCGRRHTVSI
jgi:hypothetical protein